MLVSAPGAFQWKGGYQESSRNSFQAGREHDSYLGETFRDTHEQQFLNIYEYLIIH